MESGSDLDDEYVPRESVNRIRQGSLYANILEHSGTINKPIDLGGRTWSLAYLRVNK